ncbi:alpha/beta hydrolase [Sphingomonas aracearum]|uniref:Alpha/beta hydrolase n=1 Tax=Sphingomonas aracearum TaxID=2283317 RepID=A0A369VS34_9SPHN|nr:alpha/beta hydrolase [Sphingomonas aracearum]RDE05194.1 alpha/beta hydrolase [Sphingomonas aracearum]
MTEPYVRPDVAALLANMAALQGPKMHEIGAPAARQLYAATKDLVDLPMGTLATVQDLAVPGPAGTIPAKLFDVRPHRQPGPLVVFYHGGGFVIGNVETHASFCAEVSRQLDLPVVSVEYRLAPEHPWPAAPDDAEAAARWLAGSPAELGRAVTSLVVMGDSAGGNLAIVTALALRDAPAAVPIVAQMPLYPATDWTRDYPSYDLFRDGFLLTHDSMQWFSTSYASDPQHPRTSPLVADLAGLPPAVVVTASLDPIRDQGRAYAAGLIRAGVATVYREALGNIHGFITLRRAIPSAAADVSVALAALKDMIVEAEGQRVMEQAA